MPIYYIVSGVLLVTPIAAATAIVIYALRKNRDVSASFWSKRFGFTLNARDRSASLAPQPWAGYASGTPTPTAAPSSPPQCAPSVQRQSSAAFPPSP
jgi:hypothetical protein